MRAMQVWDRQWSRSGQQTKGCGGKTPLFTHSEAPSAQSLTKWFRLFTNVLCDRLSVLFFRHAPQCFPLSQFSRKSRLLWMSEKLLGRIHSPIRWPGMLWCGCGVLSHWHGRVWWVLCSVVLLGCKKLPWMAEKDPFCFVCSFPRQALRHAQRRLEKFTIGHWGQFQNM